MMLYLFDLAENSPACKHTGVPPDLFGNCYPAPWHEHEKSPQPPALASAAAAAAKSYQQAPRAGMGQYCINTLEANHDAP